MKKTIIALMVLAGVAMAAQEYQITNDASGATSYEFCFKIETSDGIADGRVLTLQYFRFTTDNDFANGMKFNVSEGGAITLTMGEGKMGEAWISGKEQIGENTFFTPNDSSERQVTFMGSDKNALVLQRDVIYKVSAVKNTSNMQEVTLYAWNGINDYAELSKVVYNGNMNGGNATAQINAIVNQAYFVADPPQPSPVPEPATGSLSLLALAGLCARRRKK